MIFLSNGDLSIGQVGKLVVATNELEEKRLMDLWERANLNQVPGIELVDSKSVN